VNSSTTEGYWFLFRLVAKRPVEQQGEPRVIDHTITTWSLPLTLRNWQKSCTYKSELKSPQVILPVPRQTLIPKLNILFTSRMPSPNLCFERETHITTEIVMSSSCRILERDT